MTKSKGSKKIRKEYLNDECESVCSEDSINYFLNPAVPKGKKSNKKYVKKYNKKSVDIKTIKPLKYDKKKDFETIKKKIQLKNKSDPLKLYCGDDMYSIDGLDSDIMEEVMIHSDDDDDFLDEDEILLSTDDKDDNNDKDNDDEQNDDKLDDNIDKTVDEQSATIVKQLNDKDERKSLIVEEDSDYEINEIIKWKYSEDLMVDNLEQEEDEEEDDEEDEDEDEEEEEDEEEDDEEDEEDDELERDHTELNESDKNSTTRSFHSNQRIGGAEIAKIKSTAEINKQNITEVQEQIVPTHLTELEQEMVPPYVTEVQQEMVPMYVTEVQQGMVPMYVTEVQQGMVPTYVTEVQQGMVPTYEEEYYGIENNIAYIEGDDYDEKCKKDEEEKERNSEDKGDEQSLNEERETEDEVGGEFQNRIKFLSETIAKLKAELAEAKSAVEEEKKATKIPGHVCNMSEPCTVASQLEERLRARRDAAAATYREELQQVERMVSQEISRLEEDMSKLKPLNKLAADWELPRDSQLRSIMYRHDYMLVASDLTLNIPQELKSFFSTELKEMKKPPALL